MGERTHQANKEENEVLVLQFACVLILTREATLSRKVAQVRKVSLRMGRRGGMQLGETAGLCIMQAFAKIVI